MKTMDEIRNKLLIGDCIEMMKTFPDNCVSAIITDPPYGLEFMGKGWDAPWKDGEGKEGEPEEVVASTAEEMRGFQAWTEKWSREAIRVLKPGGHLLSFAGCYDEQTEVLTHRGWIRFPDVKDDEMFASLNPDTHLVEWLPSVKKVCMDYDGPMFYYKTNRVDLLVTPNHKMFVSTMGRKKHFRLVRADEHGTAICMTKTSNGQQGCISDGDFVLPATEISVGHGHIRKVPEKRIPMNVWLPFFGLWMAEGSASTVRMRTGWGYNVAICHFDFDNLREIERLLKPYFRAHIYEKSGKLRINDKQLTEYLRQFGKAWEKRVPLWLKNLRPNGIRTFLDWYARGDGDDRGNIYTCSPHLRDDVQEIAMYAGWAADWRVARPKVKIPKIKGREIRSCRPQYVIRLLKVQVRPEVYGRGSSVKSIIPAEEWGGKRVYCVELSRNHTLYVRRNGKAVWCGNSRTYHRMACGIEEAGFQVRDKIDYHFALTQYTSVVYGMGFPKSLAIGKAVDKAMGAERKVVGTKHAANGGSNMPSMGAEKEKGDIDVDITVAGSEEGKAWKGHGTALKPAHEPVACFAKEAPPLGIDVPFQYTAKASRKERDYGCRGIFWLMDAKGNATRIQRDDYTKRLLENKNRKDEAGFVKHLLARGNCHATVKPLEMMRYLVRLVKMPGENLILDPFAGSGTTACACVLEGCGWVTIERDPVYAEVADSRIHYFRCLGKKGLV